MEKKQFQAESKRLLDLMVNSIYTHKEIFLREIISNASDAIDKLWYLSLTDDKIELKREDFQISLKADKQYRILTITDNGIGMTKEELEANLGTIAKSGSLGFKEKLPEGAEVDIIGQFGVGFYSAFMVSEAVTVVTRAYGSGESYMWQSSGADGYTVTSCEREEVGTDVILKLKEDTENEDYSQYLEQYTLSSLIKKYSDYIRWPIKMEMEKTSYEGEEKTVTTEIETLNSMVPIWQRPKSEVTEEEYFSFYKEKFNDYEDPASMLYVSAEGQVSFKALLFIPSHAPYDFYTKEYQKGLSLYSSGVLIMENCAELLPDHFRFVKGIVDSQDLSLNISRELLQHDRQLKIMATNIEKRIKSELLKLLENDRTKYEAFFGAFGLQLKYGIVSEYGAHKELLRELLMFRSSAVEGLTTLGEYVSRVKEEQKSIYYAGGDSVAKISRLPQTELLREKGMEILYFTDEVDEFVVQILMNYEEKKFKSVNSDDLELDSEDDKKNTEKLAEESKELLSFVKDTLGDKIKEARISSKLVNNPVCMSADGYISFEMEKYFNTAQPGSGAKAERVLELNPSHKVIDKLKELQEKDKEQAQKFVKILYYQALMLADLTPDDLSEYTELVTGLMLAD